MPFGASAHVALELLEVGKPRVVETNDLAIEPCGRDTKAANRLHESRKSLTPFDTAARVQSNVVPAFPCEESPAVILDLMQPVRAAWWLLDERAELRLKNSRNGVERRRSNRHD